MAKLIRSLSQTPIILLLLGLGFLTISTFPCSSSDDMQDNGLALMQQIVQPIKDNIKKEKEFWGDNEADDGENTVEYLETYNEYGNTIKEQTRLIKDNPENAQAYLDLVEAIEFQEIFNSKADDKSQKKAHQEMVRWLTAAIKQNSDNKELYRKRADAYFSSEQFQKAKANYTHIIKMDPQDGDAFSSRGRTYEKLGLKKEAQQDFETYAKIQPNTADQYYRRGLFYYFRGNFDLAEPAFTKYIESDPTKGSGEIFRAEIYFAQNRFDESIADYKKMNELNPGTTVFGLSRIGLNYYYQGNYQMAENTFVETLKLDSYLETVIGWYLSRQKQGKSSQAALEYMAGQFGDEHLEGSVIHLFLDKLSPEELLKKKLDPPGITADHSSSIAYFYLGQYYLMRNNPSQAKTMFEQSIKKSKVPYSPGKLFSEKELARLNSNKNSDAQRQ